MESENTHTPEPLDYDRLLAQIKESGQPIEQATATLTAAVSWCIKQSWGGERAQQYEDAFDALRQRHTRVEGMDVPERLGIWWMNPGHSEAAARVLAFNLDYAIDLAVMKVGESAVACDKAKAAFEAHRSKENCTAWDAAGHQLREALHRYTKAVEAYQNVWLDFPDILTFYQRQFLAKRKLTLPAEFKEKFDKLYCEAHDALIHGKGSDQFKRADRAVEDFLHEHGSPELEGVRQAPGSGSGTVDVGRKGPAQPVSSDDSPAPIEEAPCDGLGSPQPHNAGTPTDVASELKA